MTAETAPVSAGGADRPLSGKRRVGTWLKARLEWIGLGLAVFLYLRLHVQVLVTTFGEADGARLAGDAASWHFSGVVRLAETDYRMRTSPLYVHALKRFLDAGVSLGQLPVLMSWLSCLSSGVALTAAYLLFKRLVGRTAAAVAIFLLGCAPAFWLSGAYGMAHGPGLALWLSALLSFARCLDETAPRPFWRRAGLTAFLVFLAVGFKADLILNGLAFPGLLLVRRNLTRRNLGAACGVVVSGMAVQIAYVKLVVARPLPVVAHDLSTAQFAVAFNKRFPFSLDAFSDRVGFSAIDHAPGPFLFAVGVVAAFAYLLGRPRWRLGVFAAAWALPIVLFWGFQVGNSARHNLSALPPLMLLTGAMIAFLVETPVRAGILSALLAFINYHTGVKGEPDGFGTVVPITNLMELSESVAANSRELEGWAQKFARATGKKALLARSSLPFAVYAELREQSRSLRPSFDGSEIRTRLPDGSVRVVKAVYLQRHGEGHSITRALRADGFDVWRRD